MSLVTVNADNVFTDGVVGKVRKGQEDSHGVAKATPNGDVFVVCDGMGGHVGGQKASSIAVDSILEYLKREKYDDSVKALDQALQFANMQILGHASRHPELKGMGTTACILLLRGNEAYIAHVGDSRIYLYLGKEKQLHRVTKDHSYVQTLVDLPDGHPEKISDEEAESHPNKNRILKALGIKPELYPTITSKPILPKTGDVFLICSDGLNGMISDDTICGVLSGRGSIKQKGNLLIDLAMEAGGRDNITVELIQISNSPHKRSVFRSCNPQSNGKLVSGVYRGPLRVALKWVAVAAAIIVVGFGGLYIYGKRVNNMVIRENASGIESLQASIRRHEVDILRRQADYDKSIKETKDAERQHHMSPNNAGFRDAYQRAQDAADSKKNLLNEAMSNRDADSLKLKELINDSADIAKLKWYEFLKPQRNESSDDRTGDEQ